MRDSQRAARSGRDLANAPVYRRVRSQALHEGVVRQIIRQIVAGVPPPGEALPTEPQLAERFGVSRTVIREAVRVLVAKGLIQVRQGSGMWVRPPEKWDQFDPIILLERVRSGQEDRLLHELLEVRRIVEVEAVALAAERHTPDDLAALRRLVEAMPRATDDPDAYVRLDFEFHDRLLAMTGNAMLAQMARPLNELLFAAWTITGRAGFRRALVVHPEILQAVEESDSAKAREIMDKHITQFIQALRAILENGKGELFERVLAERASSTEWKRDAGGLDGP